MFAPKKGSWQVCSPLRWVAGRNVREGNVLLLEPGNISKSQIVGELRMVILQFFIDKKTNMFEYYRISVYPLCSFETIIFPTILPA